MNLPIVRMVLYGLGLGLLAVALVCWAFPPPEGAPADAKKEQPALWLILAVFVLTLASV